MVKMNCSRSSTWTCWNLVFPPLGIASWCISMYS